MSERRRARAVLSRADRVFDGAYRLRLPLPWPGVPHGNAYALPAGDGIVLVDTGIYGEGSMEQLERALGQAGHRLGDVSLLVCTHAHSDHYGQAGPIVDAAGCELWMHPDHAHMTRAAADPERDLERRIEIARQSGVPAEPLERYAEQRRGMPLGIERVVLPSRDLVDGVEVETDLGPLRVYETPGHAPSHVCLFQPQHRLLLSGDHLLGRVSPYYDFGYTPDPAGEFLASLDVVEDLGAGLCLSGHGRPFRDVQAHVDANRVEVGGRIDRLRAGLAEGEACTPFELVPVMLGEDVSPALFAWHLTETLCYLRHLEVLGRAEQTAPAVEGEPAQWTVARGSG